MKHFKVLSPLLLGGLIAYFLLLRLYNKEENFEELALGEQTVSHFASIDGVPIHIMGARNYELLKKRWKQSRKDSTILVLGNSQTHSVNQMRDGETTYPALLHDELANTKYEVLASSLPNANLQEFYIVLDFMTRELPVTHVTIPVFMDDLREDGIRADLINDIKKADPDFKIEANHTLANKINKLLAEEKVQDQSASNLEIDLTPQERSEQFLNEWLEKQTDIWHKRSSVRGDLFNRLYNFRNWLFGINAQTKRKLIKDRYDANMFALDAILKLCKARNIKPVIYIPPIRHDVEIPYDQVEYNSFKKRLNNLAASYNYKLENLENAVPNNYWGTKASTTGEDGGELDFMHFQYKGHIILAKRLKEQVL